MISEETLVAIYSCYREIRVGKKLLEEVMAINDNPDAPKLNF